MKTPNQNAPEILREEILADARRQSDECIRRAQQEAEALLSKAVAEADTARQDRLQQARGKADRQKELILATVAVEAGRLRLARLEALLESVREEVRQRLAAHEGFDYGETVVALAVEAIKQMRGSEFLVKLSSSDRDALGDGLAAEISLRVGRSPLNITIADHPSLAEGGTIIEDTDGSQVWDNRLQARLERLWPELRRLIAVQTALVGASSTTGGAP